MEEEVVVVEVVEGRTHWKKCRAFVYYYMKVRVSNNASTRIGE